MNKSESIKSIAVALAKFNGEVARVAKDASNPFFKSKYVTLDALIEATRGILQSNGLSVMQFPLGKESGEIGIQTLLLHESGEYIESEQLYMNPVKNDPQTAGSLITYLRRYSYQAILNLSTGEDDDGNKSTHGGQTQLISNPSANTDDKKALSDKQMTRLYAIAIAKGVTNETVVKNILKKYSCTPNYMTKIQYDEFVTGLQQMSDKA